MPLYMSLDPSNPSTSFTYTPDSEIVAMYENGLAMKAIVKAVVWQDRVKKSVAERRVNSALYNYHVSGVRLLPCEVANPFQ